MTEASSDSCKALVVKDEDGIEYSLLKAPDDKSKYVVEIHKTLTESLQINELAFDLANVGKFILMAYCGVMGHLRLEIQVRERLHSIVKLCDDTVHTLNEFSRASTTAITNMATAYEYLVDGFEDIALETLQDVAKISKDMQDRSLELKNRFGDEADEIKKVHDVTASEKQKVFDANSEAKNTMKILKTDESTAKKEIEKASEEEEESKKNLEFTREEERKITEDRRKIAAKLAKEIDEIQIGVDKVDEQIIAYQPQTGIFSRLKSGFTHLLGGQTDDDVEANASRIAKQNTKDKRNDAILKAKEAKEAENMKAKVFKEQRLEYARALEKREKRH